MSHRAVCENRIGARKLEEEICKAGLLVVDLVIHWNAQRRDYDSRRDYDDPNLA